MCSEVCGPIGPLVVAAEFTSPDHAHRPPPQGDAIVIRPHVQQSQGGDDEKSPVLPSADLHRFVATSDEGGGKLSHVPGPPSPGCSLGRPDGDSLSKTILRSGAPRRVPDACPRSADGTGSTRIDRPVRSRSARATPRLASSAIPSSEVDAAELTATSPLSSSCSRGRTWATSWRRSKPSTAYQSSPSSAGSRGVC